MKACIIGAGAAGITAAKAFAEPHARPAHRIDQAHAPSGRNCCPPWRTDGSR